MQQQAEKTNLMGSIAVPMVDLLFILFEFSCFAYVDLASALLVRLNPNQSNRRLAVQ